MFYVLLCATVTAPFVAFQVNYEVSPVLAKAKRDLLEAIRGREANRV